MAHEHGKMQITKQSGGFPWPPVVVVIALLILAAILWLMPRPSQMTAAPPQENQAPSTAPNALTGDQLQFQQVQIKASPAPLGGNTNLVVEGALYNAGDQPVTGATVQAVFLDSGGKMVLQQQQPLEILLPEKRGRNEVSALPAARGVDGKGTAPFRVTFTSIPATWNKDKPELTATQIQTAGQSEKVQKPKY
jgi:hypothetical protein